MSKMVIAGLMAAVAVPLVAQVPSAPPAAPLAPRPPVPPMAPMADKVVTRAEVQTMVQSHFARIDANRDGFVAADEMKMGKRHGAMKGRRAARAMGDSAQAFDRLDSNRDGMISRDEFARGRELMLDRRAERKGAGAPGAHRMRGHGMGMMRGHMLKLADANKDGRVSLQEATQGALQHFDKVDANRDGRITPDERRAARGMRMHKAG